MKQIIIRFGVIAGAILILNMILTTYLCYENPDFKFNEVIGFTALALAFTSIYNGIKKVRQQDGGFISFGKALKTGLLITLIASVIYVGVWLIEYYVFVPDFMDKYSAVELAKAKSSGLDAAALEAKIKTIDQYKEMYKNPLWVMALTFMEVFPLGFVVALISALVLKKKPL